MAKVFGIAYVQLTVLLVLFVSVQLLIFRSLLLMIFETSTASDMNLNKVQTYQEIDSYRWHRGVQSSLGSKMQTVYHEQRANTPTFRGAKMVTASDSDWSWARTAPTLEYEKTRRRLKMIVEDFGYFLGNQIKTLKEDIERNNTVTSEKLTTIFNQGIEYKRTLMGEVAKLSRVDGYDEWRFREAADLSDLVQRRLQFLQNPKDCRRARKLVCDLRKACGFGCQLHHVVYCLITAYTTQRTLILFSHGWRYNEHGWGAVFQPLSETCREAGFGYRTHWNGFEDPSPVVYLPIVEHFPDLCSQAARSRPQRHVPSCGHPYLPRAIPADLAQRISRLHGEPAVWWVGQMVKYLVRINPGTLNKITDAPFNITSERPIVGVHIRRTDKLGVESAFYPVEDYMNHVDEFYKQLPYSQNVKTKRLYLATDDVRVFEEIHAKYPDYTVVGNPKISETAGTRRYCSECLEGLILDLHSLAHSDFLVCTFSSQVCRLAYEMMQFLHPDAADRFRSLDDLYYFGGGGIHRVVALMSHTPASVEQMDLKVGDHVKIFGNLWKGYSAGFNFRTQRTGLFPSYKVEDVIEAVDFPSTYPQVPIRKSRRFIPK